MVEVGDTVYNYTFPEECSICTIISKKSETKFIAEFMNRKTGELYKRINFDYNISK